MFTPAIRATLLLLGPRQLVAADCCHQTIGNEPETETV
jgi:hypothetical protein